MNDEFFDAAFDPTEDPALARSLDRLADGECSSEETAELFARLDEAPGGWKACALALLEARELRQALSAVDRGSDSPAPVEPVAAVASGAFAAAPGRSNATRWFAAALAAVLAFVAGIAVSPDGSPRAPQAVDARDAATGEVGPATSDGGNVLPGASDEKSPRAPQVIDADLAAPEIVNVVYRPEGAEEERSAPLPVYKSNETWTRVLDEAVRKSEADLAARRAVLLARGADVERQIVLHPVVADGKAMLVPVETFRVVPAPLSSYH